APAAGGMRVNLGNLLSDYINAAFTGLWVQTHEPDEAEREIARHASQKKWKLAIWDVANGIRGSKSEAAGEVGAGDPLAALRALPELADEDGTAVLVMHNLH